MVKKKDRYYVYKDNGVVHRIAKLGDNGAFGWEDGQWVEMPGLWKIEWEVTDYDEITKEEAEELILAKREQGRVNMDSALLNKAIVFATEKHANQVRKGSTKPYITHPLETMAILNYMQADINLLVVGVLHDTIEDTDATYEEIEKEFGSDVAELVGKHSEDKSKSWMERRQNAIDELENAPLRVKMLVLADKVANLRSMCIDYQNLGEELWERFNAPKDKQAWYYSGVQDALGELNCKAETAEIYWEMVGRFKDLFVEYYIDGENEILYQVCADSTTWMLKKEDCTWISVIEMVDGLEQISRHRAEFIEDIWNEVREVTYS